MQFNVSNKTVKLSVPVHIKIYRHSNHGDPFYQSFAYVNGNEIARTCVRHKTEEDAMYDIRVIIQEL